MKKLGQVTDKKLIAGLNEVIMDHQETISALEEEIDELKIRIDGLLEENKDLEIIRRVLRIDTYGVKY